MDYPFIISSLIATGISIGTGAKLLPLAYRSRHDLKELNESPQGKLEAERKRQSKKRNELTNPRGKKRESSILGFHDDVIRHTDGSYTRGYNLPLQATMLSPDEVIDNRTDDFSSMLAKLPVNARIQFRYAVAPDPGRAVAEHLRAREFGQVHEASSILHDLNLDYLGSMANANLYRYERASVYITIPTSHIDDNSHSGMGAFLSLMKDEIRNTGFRRAKDSISRNRAMTKKDGVVKRILEVEQQTFREAEKATRLIEMNSPVKLERMTRDELWKAVYTNHNLSSRSIPKLPQRDGLDIRDSLCADSIEARNWYVMHGDTPVTIVSLFVPADGDVFADAMRVLTSNPDLTFKHTIITEFIKVDKSEAKKSLDKTIKHVERSGNQSDGSKNLSPEAQQSLDELKQARSHIVKAHEAFVKMHCYVVIYGDRSRTKVELKQSLEKLDYNADRIVSAFQQIEGAEAGREEKAALHCLYPQTLIGESSNKPNGRELSEVGRTMAVYIPCESAWHGSHNPHSLFKTVSGRLIGFNSWDKSERTKIKSPVIPIIGEMGAGKTTQGSTLIVNSLATVPGVKVLGVDVGGSLAPLAEVIGARYFRFKPEDPKPVNSYDYPELEEGRMPSENHKTLMAMDTLSLTGRKEESPDYPTDMDVVMKALIQVLKNTVARNGPGKKRREATLSDLHAMLDSYDYGSPGLNERARAIALSLEKHIGNPWLDAPTHPDFLNDSQADFFELDSLSDFPPDVKQALALRIAARVIRAIGKLRQDGTRTPTLIVFDEVHAYHENFPALIPVIKKGARQGRKHNVVTLLITHTYEDFRGFHDVTANAGVKLIGKQTGDLSMLIEHAQLNPRTVAAIDSIKNVDGLYTEWVLVIGKGKHQQVEMIQNHLSPPMLWTFTTNPDEANARAIVQQMHPELSMSEVVAALAKVYPQGLAAQGIIFDKRFFI